MKTRFSTPNFNITTLGEATKTKTVRKVIVIENKVVEPYSTIILIKLLVFFLK